MNREAHVLEKVAVTVLEKWAMMMVDPTDSSTSIFEIDQPLYRSSIRVDGPFHGEISIVAQKPFLDALTNNLLGDCASASEEVAQDAFREMGNVLAGNFITEAYGNDVAFDVLNPQVSEINETELQTILSVPQVYYFAADDSPVVIAFCIKG